MTESELMDFYHRNEDFHAYVEHFRRETPLTVEEVLEKQIVKNVAEDYRKKEVDG